MISIMNKRNLFIIFFQNCSEPNAPLKMHHLAYDLDSGTLILQPLHHQLRAGGRDHDGGWHSHFSGRKGCSHTGVTSFRRRQGGKKGEKKGKRKSCQVKAYHAEAAVS